MKMEAFPIVKYPSETLRKKSEKVEAIDNATKALAPRMAFTMHKCDGVGLAASQIGFSQQIIIVQDLENEEGSFCFINPKIKKTGKKMVSEEEGCLSLPGLFVPVKRYEEVEVECQTLQGKSVLIKAEGLAARIFQHEIDHLNGKLIINRITLFKKFSIRKELEEIRKYGRTRKSIKKRGMVEDSSNN